VCSGLAGGHIFSHELEAWRYSQFKTFRHVEKSREVLRPAKVCRLRKKPKLSCLALFLSKLKVEMGCASVIT
jgi:hypothetical protein